MKHGHCKVRACPSRACITDTCMILALHILDTPKPCLIFKNQKNCVVDMSASKKYKGHVLDII